VGYVLLEVFEFEEYCLTYSDKGTNSGGLFVEYVYMFLKLEEESPRSSSWVQSEDDKDRFIEDYRLAEGIALARHPISKLQRKGIW